MVVNSLSTFSYGAPDQSYAGSPPVPFNRPLPPPPPPGPLQQPSERSVPPHQEKGSRGGGVSLGIVFERDLGGNPYKGWNVVKRLVKVPPALSLFGAPDLVVGIKGVNLRIVPWFPQPDRAFCRGWPNLCKMLH